MSFEAPQGPFVPAQSQDPKVGLNLGSATNSLGGDVHEVVLTVSDGEDSDTLSFAVTALNALPVLEEAKDAGYPFKLTQRIRLFDPEGYPAIKPPWGYMTAIDLDKGDFAWRTVNGEYPELKKRGIPKTGTHADGGAIATAGELEIGRAHV